MMKKVVIRNSVLLVLLVLAVILIPFFLSHEYFDGWTQQILRTFEEHPLLTATLLGILLLSDILLPVPSSIVSTGAGFLFGFVNGSLISFIGMTLGCVLGYFLGKGSGKLMSWLDENTKNSMESFFKRSGNWSVVIARPIPVLAEGSVFFAGISRMNFSSFMWSTSLANLGISMVYAAVGTYAVSVNSVLLAFSGAIILPALAWIVEKIYRKKDRTNHSVIH